MGTATPRNAVALRTARMDSWRLLRTLWHSSIEGCLVTFAPASGSKGLGRCVAGDGAGLRVGRCDVIPGHKLEMEGQHAAGSHPALLQPPARAGFYFAKQPSLRKSHEDRSHLLVPGPGTAGNQSPVAPAAMSGRRSNAPRQHRPVRHPLPAHACLRAAPCVPQPGGPAQAGDQPAGDGARDDLQLHC